MFVERVSALDSFIRFIHHLNLHLYLLIPASGLSLDFSAEYCYCAYSPFI